MNSLKYQDHTLFLLTNSHVLWFRPLVGNLCGPQDNSAHLEIILLNLSTKTYVVVTQNRLNETAF